MRDQAPEPLDAEQSERDALARDLYVTSTATHQPMREALWDDGPLPDENRRPSRRQSDDLIARGWSRSPRPANPHPRVQGRCPACGSESLFLGAGGYVTCGLIECREPDAATTALEPAARPATVSDAEEVLLAHMWDASDDRLCSCGWSPDDYWQHDEGRRFVADALINAEDGADPNPWGPIIVAFVEHQAAALPHLTTQPADVDRRVREAEALPVINHKGPHDTDEAMFERMAWKLRNGYDVAGSNGKDALARLIDREVERARSVRDEGGERS